MNRNEERDFRTLMDGLTRALAGTQKGKSPTPLTPAMHKTLREIAGDWHSGLGTALYNFSSSGKLDCDADTDRNDYLRAVDRSLAPETLSKTDDPAAQERRLKALRLFFELYAEEYEEA